MGEKKFDLTKNNKVEISIEQKQAVSGNREPEKSRKSIEDEKRKVENEKKVSEAVLERDWSCSGAHRESLKSDSELRRKS